MLAGCEALEFELTSHAPCSHEGISAPPCGSGGQIFARSSTILGESHAKKVDASGPAARRPM